MGRKRNLAIGDPELTIREMVIRSGIDPINELLQMSRETLPYPDKEFLEANPGWIKNMLDDGYALYVDEETGKKRLRMARRFKAEIMAKLAPFIHPTLKSSESKETKDWKIEVSIRSFDQREEKTITVDATPEPQQQIAEETK